ASVQLMDEFLRAWFPYGRRIEELQEILGVDVQSGKVVGTATVRIDSGYGGWEYCFKLKNGVIQAVKKNGID
ncbi:MAG: hypothetical protein L0Y56_15215, partial [Nitrospira sp.]|nr:hypothetical protein [Nitrospira sp.]